MFDLFFFAAETPAKKNAHALPSGLEAGQKLLHAKSLREALGLSLFCPLSRKREKYIPLRS
jgi:hypothetical protein